MWTIEGVAAGTGTASLPEGQWSKVSINLGAIMGATGTFKAFTLQGDGDGNERYFLDNVSFTASTAPAAPSVSVATGAVSVTEGAGASASVTFSLNTAQATDVTVTYSTVNGTATAPGDFTAATSATVIIPAGSTSVTFPVAITDDTVFEPTETFSVVVNGATLNGAAIAASGTVTVTITDNDPAPVTVSISAVAPGSVVEGAPAGVVFTLSAAQATDVTVTYSTVDDTAVSPGDFTAQTAATVIIPAGQTTAAVSIATINDAFTETPERFLNRHLERHSEWAAFGGL